MPTWLVPLLPLLGVVVGAATQYMLSRTQEAERQRRTLRTTAYVDYLRGVTASIRSASPAPDMAGVGGPLMRHGTSEGRRVRMGASCRCVAA
jgi:hypothetical protein